MNRMLARNVSLAMLSLAGCSVIWSQAACAQALPNTKPLEAQGDLASAMVDGIDKFLLREIEASVEKRAKHWNRDTSSAENYDASVAPNRARLKKIIGVLDAREPFEGIEYVATSAQPALVGRGEGFEVYAVRWPVFRGVEGEGLLLKPTGKPPIADVVAIPDADQTPEMLCGLVPGIAPESQFARRLAESGCRVVVPMLIDRADTYSVMQNGAATNQPHREFVYRPAFEMGRHIIGYEVQKVLALVDWFTREAGHVGRPFQADSQAGKPDLHATGQKDARIGVYGYGEGGLLALYSGAIDTRIDAVGVSGYFGPRERVWEEPIYRNVFGLLEQFGDAELGLLANCLIVEASRGPSISGPPAPRQGRSGAAPGGLSPQLNDVQAQAEFRRVAQILGKEETGWFDACNPRLASHARGWAEIGDAVDSVLQRLLASDQIQPAKLGPTPTHFVKNFDPAPRLKRQLAQLLEDTQYLMREAEYTREAFWAKADRSSLVKFQSTVEQYRKVFYDDVIGRFDHPLEAANPRSRKIYDEPSFSGYEVMLDVFPDVFAYGILLVPKDIKPGERRPVVVCQHGLEGRPTDVADPAKDHPAYHRYACKLAERGFITYAPQNPYIFTDRFRSLQRKANPLGKTLFSIIVPQHQQTVDWLASLPMVDPERIAFYGLSYGGKTAMRVPPLVSRYCLSICSADFNEWIWKNTSTRANYSYVRTGEYEIFEFDLGNTFNYAEMAALIAPRPFMVERGHRDGVAPDHWVGYEFAKVRRIYTDLKIADRATIEWFDGPHTINGVGTFEFLHKHLRWPKE